ncbi:MAG: hypothetical protein ACR2L3_00905 [Actinomycetota bacterium]
MLSVYATLDADRFPTGWQASLSTGDNEPITQELEVGSQFSYVKILGAADPDLDGTDEAFIRTKTHLYHSGATHEVGIFGFDDGKIFQVTVEDAPLNFQVGAISYFSQGAECRDVDFDGKPEFVTLAIDGVINDVQKWTEKIYTWGKRALILSDRNEGKLAKTSYTDPLLRRFYGLRCFEFDPPAPY